jgi:hypothetical protein
MYVWGWAKMKSSTGTPLLYQVVMYVWGWAKMKSSIGTLTMNA